MKKFMSTKMKVFISILATIFISCYIAAGIVLYNSDYKLINYIDNLPINWHWSSNFNTYNFDFYASRQLNIDNTINNININTTESNINIEYTDNPSLILEINSNVDDNKSFDDLIDTFSITNNQVNIKTNESNLNFFEHVNLTLFIPKTYKNIISINTTSGGVNFNYLELSSLSISSISSDIDIYNVNINDLYINSTSGDITLSNINSKKSNINTTSGDISIDTSIVGNSNLKTVSGEIDAHLNDLGDTSDFTTTSGDIDLYINNSIGYNLKFNSTTGEFSNPKSDNYNSNNYINGDGLKLINVTTTSGNLELN